MAKKKNKQEFEEDFKDEEDFEDESAEDNFVDEPDPNENVDSDSPINPIGMAYLINKESDTAKHFVELPREIRNSFLDATEKADVRHHARSYRNWKYICKTIELRDEEDKKLYSNNIKLETIKSKEGIIEYLQSQSKDYLITIVNEMEEKDLTKFLKHIGMLSPDYYATTFENKKNKINSLYETYNLINNVPKVVDDMDNLGKNIDTAIGSMGFKGNAVNSGIMTINAVKNEDISKSSEERTKFSILDSIKRKFG